MKFFLQFLFILISFSLNSQVIYNAYARVTAVTSSTFLTLTNPNEVNHTFSVGEKVIVMQMQDNVIGTNTTNATSFGNLGGIANAGNFEVGTIAVVNRSAGTATSIGLSTALLNTYNTGTNSRVQIISFRLLNAAAFTTTAAITGLTWNGNVGGVIALNVGTDFTISHSITANGLGFRGGAVSSNYYGGGTTCSTLTPVTSSTRCGVKGEGIYAVTSATQTTGTAKVLNGGGGGGQDINGGGGGGGNYTAGGLGGNGWNGSGGGCSPSAAAFGGITLSVSISGSRVFMGGGGGGGQQNDGVGSSGGNGGGIILIKANRILTGGCSSNPTITANGNNSANVGNDGAGGAGAGGSIVLSVPNYSVSSGCPLTIRANGGNGGNVSNPQNHAGGGAGGQGAVVYSIPQPTTNITTITNNGTPGCNNSGCSNSAGSAGGTNNNGIVVNATGPLPIKLISFQLENQLNSVLLKWITATEVNTDYFIIERSMDGLEWNEILRKKASENSTNRKYYEAEDLAPLNNLTYYRLKTIDKDLSVSYSPIEFMNRGLIENLIYYPNPAHTELTIVSPTSIELFSFEILNTMGEILPIATKEIVERKINLDLTHLTKGVYFIKTIVNNNYFQFHKFIIQ